jgi:hypothetical protein
MILKHRMTKMKKDETTNLKSISMKAKFIFLTLIVMLLPGLYGETDKEHKSVELSPHKVFILVKYEALSTEPTPVRFNLERDGRLLRVIDNITGEQFYEIIAPREAVIDARLDRGFDGFYKAYVLPSGDLLLDYHGSEEKVYYSKGNNSFTLLPSYLKKDGEYFLANGWDCIKDGFLISFSRIDFHSSHYVLFELNSGKVYEVMPPEDIQESHYLVRSIDKSLGIVELQAYTIDGDPDNPELHHDADIILKDFLGIYKIVEKP